MRLNQRLCRIEFLDTTDPVPRPVIQIEVVAHDAATGDENAEIGAFIAVIAGAG